MKNKNFIKSIFALFFVQFSNYLAPLFVLPYLGRKLGIQGYGYVVILLSFISIMSIIIDYGFNISAIPKIINNNNNNNNNKYVNDLISKILLIRIIAVFIITIFAWTILRSSVGNVSNFVFAFIFMALLGQALQATYLFQAIEKMKLIAYIAVVTKILFLILVFLLIRGKDDEDYVIVAYSISSFLGGVVTIYFVFREGYRFQKIKLTEILSELKESFPFFLSRAAVSLYTALNTLIIGGTVGKIEAGLYGSSEKVYQAAQSLTVPFNAAIYPHILKNKNKPFLFKSVFVVSFLLVIICGFVSIYSEYILLIIFGPEFTDAHSVLSILILITPITFVSINFGYPVFALLNKIKVANVTVIIGSIFHIVVMAVLYITDSISAINVSYALLITESIVCISRLLLFLIYTKTEV